jgi:hypothetical protein
MTNELDPKRVQEMFWLFSKVLPLDDTGKAQASQIFGVEFTKLIPDLALTLGSECSKYLEEFNGYCEFLIEAISYMRLETNDQPNIDYDNEELKKHMTDSLKDFDKNAREIKL